MAVLASQRCSDHTLNTEIRLIITPQTNKLINDGLLLRDAVHLGHKTWVEDHATIIEPSTQSEREPMAKVQK